MIVNNTTRIIEKLFDQSYIPYRYSDCDGDNNHGIRFDKYTFIELLATQYKLVKLEK